MWSACEAMFMSPSEGMGQYGSLYRRSGTSCHYCRSDGDGHCGISEGVEWVVGGGLPSGHRSLDPYF